MGMCPEHEGKTGYEYCKGNPKGHPSVPFEALAHGGDPAVKDEDALNDKENGYVYDKTIFVWWILPRVDVVWSILLGSIDA
jgi:hypothetical protein